MGGAPEDDERRRPVRPDAQQDLDREGRQQHDVDAPQGKEGGAVGRQQGLDDEEEDRGEDERPHRALHVPVQGGVALVERGVKHVGEGAHGLQRASGTAGHGGPPRSPAGRGPGLEQHEAGLLQAGLDGSQQLGPHRAVDDPVVGGERARHHAADADAVARRHGSPGRRPHPENAALRRIDDGVEALDAVHPEVRDGERAARVLVGGEAPFPRPGGESAGLTGDGPEVLPVRAANHRRHQALRRIDGHRDVHALVDADRSVHPRGVGLGHRAERAGGGPDDHIREGGRRVRQLTLGGGEEPQRGIDPALGAQVEVGDRLLGLLHEGGGHPAHGRQRLLVVGRRSARRGSRRSRRHRGRARSARLRRRELPVFRRRAAPPGKHPVDVRLADPAVGAGGPDGGQVQTGRGGHAESQRCRRGSAGRRRGRLAPRCRSLGRSGRGLARPHRRFPRRRPDGSRTARRAGSGPRRGRSFEAARRSLVVQPGPGPVLRVRIRDARHRWRRIRGLPDGGDPPEHCADLQAVRARRDTKVAQHARGRGLQLDGGLVGLDLGDRLPHLDPLALPLQPRPELDRRDGIGQPGKSNLGRLRHLVPAGESSGGPPAWATGRRLVGPTGTASSHPDSRRPDPSAAPAAT